MEDSLQKIVEKIARIRKNKGLSYDNMASDLALSPSAYRKIETGETKLTVERLLQISKVLEISIDTILENNSVKQVKQENYNNSSVVAYSGNNIYTDVSALTQKLIETYETQIQELRIENAALKKT